MVKSLARLALAYLVERYIVRPREPMGTEKVSRKIAYHVQWWEWQQKRGYPIPGHVYRTAIGVFLCEADLRKSLMETLDGVFLQKLKLNPPEPPKGSTGFLVGVDGPAAQGSIIDTRTKIRDADGRYYGRRVEFGEVDDEAE